MIKNSFLNLAKAILVAITVSSCHNSENKITASAAAKDSTAHLLLHTDSSTLYLDATGNRIDTKQFMENMKSGKFTFVPDMKDGKVISVGLKASVQKAGMGAIAPELSGTDLKGHPVSLEMLRGKTVVLNFWFIACAPCRAEIPGLNALVDKYRGDKSVVFIAITYDSPEQVAAFIKRMSFKFTLLAGRPDIIERYGITSYPTSLVIDKSGNIAFLLNAYDGTNVEQLDGVIGALKEI